MTLSYAPIPHVWMVGGLGTALCWRLLGFPGGCIVHEKPPRWRVAMSIGTAIFLSAVILAVVALYGLTMDRWPWKAIVLGIARTLAWLALLAIVLAFIILYQHPPLR